MGKGTEFILFVVRFIGFYFIISGIAKLVSGVQTINYATVWPGLVIVLFGLISIVFGFGLFSFNKKVRYFSAIFVLINTGLLFVIMRESTSPFWYIAEIFINIFILVYLTNKKVRAIYNSAKK